MWTNHTANHLRLATECAPILAGALPGRGPRLLGLLLLWLCWSTASHAGVVVQLEQADFLVSNAASPPADHAPWRPLALPDFWKKHLLDSRQGQELGWYRLSLTLSEAPQQALAIYLPRLSMNAAVYLNGEWIGDGGNMHEPVARNWNRPLIFSPPGSLWRAGENHIHVQLRVSRNGAGVLAPISIGPEPILRAEYEQRRFSQNTLSVGLFFITMAVAIFMLALWTRLRHELMYLLFGASALVWSFYSLNLFITYIPFSVPTWWWLVHSSIDGWVILLALFTHRFLGLHRPRTEILLVAFALIGMVFYSSLTPAGSFNRMNALWHLGTGMIGSYIAVLLLIHSIKNRSAEGWAFTIMMVAIVLLGSRDWYMNSGHNPQLWLQNFHALHFAAPLMFLVMTWHLTSRFIQALHESRRLNAHLEDAIVEARNELEQSYAEKAVLARAHAATRERERLLRDLHDDIGAKLLSLIYQAESEQNADLARSVLEDIRHVVSRPPPRHDSLHQLLDSIEHESRDRLGSAGIRLNWQRDPQLPDPPWHSEASLNLSRVIREAISNVIHHAKASHVQVQILRADQDMLIDIYNDGGETDEASHGSGMGSRNMQYRVQHLGGEVLSQQTEDNLSYRLRIRIPISAPASVSTEAAS